MPLKEGINRLMLLAEEPGCVLPSDHQPTIQSAIAAFSASEFHQQPVLSDKTAYVTGNAS